MQGLRVTGVGRCQLVHVGLEGFPPKRALQSPYCDICCAVVVPGVQSAGSAVFFSVCFYHTLPLPLWPWLRGSAGSPLIPGSSRPHLPVLEQETPNCSRRSAVSGRITGKPICMKPMSAIMVMLCSYMTHRILFPYLLQTITKQGGLVGMEVRVDVRSKHNLGRGDSAGSELIQKSLRRSISISLPNEQKARNDFSGGVMPTVGRRHLYNWSC